MEPVVLKESYSHGSSSTASKQGFLYRLDRLLRRWLPGYSYLRGKRRSGSASASSLLLEGKTCSGGGTGGGLNTIQELGNRCGKRGNNKNEVYLDTGIAKSEFCLQLEVLLRNKMLKQKQLEKEKEKDKEKVKELEMKPTGSPSMTTNLRQ
ncbi:hypothetical protein KR026_010814 [Drosophila bipectinata]|nr:hypothetical protein KR026_010814 [Drosophila bipectinata]